MLIICENLGNIYNMKLILNKKETIYLKVLLVSVNSLGDYQRKYASKFGARHKSQGYVIWFQSIDFEFMKNLMCENEFL